MDWQPTVAGSITVKIIHEIADEEFCSILRGGGAAKSLNIKIPSSILINYQQGEIRGTKALSLIIITTHNLHNLDQM